MPIPRMFSSSAKPHPIHRVERDGVACLIRRFLDRELTAFELNRHLMPYGDSRDRVVALAVTESWRDYDDFQDHYVQLAKPDWDRIQRLLLLLASDWTWSRAVRCRRHWTQTVAGGMLLTAAAAAWGGGFETSTLLLLVPLGIVSAVLQFVRDRRTDSESEPDRITAPFRSLPELWDVYRSVKGFRKMRHPWLPTGDPPRPRPWYEIQLPVIEWAGMATLWAAFSPLILLFQTAPLIAVTTRLVPGGEASPASVPKHRGRDRDILDAPAKA